MTTENTELNPTDFVLVRDKKENKWMLDIFSHKDPNNVSYPFVCLQDNWEFCIPYKGNEHLLNTNKAYQRIKSRDSKILSKQQMEIIFDVYFKETSWEEFKSKYEQLQQLKKEVAYIEDTLAQIFWGFGFAEYPKKSEFLEDEYQITVEGWKNLLDQK